MTPSELVEEFAGTRREGNQNGGRNELLGLNSGKRCHQVILWRGFRYSRRVETPNDPKLSDRSPEARS